MSQGKTQTVGEEYVIVKRVKLIVSLYANGP